MQVSHESSGTSPPSGSAWRGAVLAWLLPLATGAVSLIVGLALSGPPELRVVLCASSAALILGAAFVLLSATVNRARVQLLETLPEALATVRTEVANLDAVRREHSKLRASLEDATASLSAMLSAVARVEAVSTGLQEVDRTIGETRHAMRQAEKREEETAKTALDFVRAEERAFRQRDGTDALSRAGEDRARAMIRDLAHCGVTLIDPKPADVVHPSEHEVVGTDPSDTVPEGSVLRCAAWGYRYRGQVLTLARVTTAARPPPAMPPAPALPPPPTESVATPDPGQAAAPPVPPSSEAVHG